MTCKPVEWKIRSNSARRPEICNPGSLRRVTRFSPKDKTLAVAKVSYLNRRTLVALSRVAHTLGISASYNIQPKANLFTRNAVCGMVILFLFLPLTCNRGTKTWGCSTYPDSFSCCISNTVRHLIEQQTIVRFDMLKRHLRDATCLIHERSPALDELHIGASSTLALQYLDREHTVRKEIQLRRLAAGTQNSRKCCNDCRKFGCTDGLDTGSKILWVLLVSLYSVSQKTNQSIESLCIRLHEDCSPRCRRTPVWPSTLQHGRAVCKDLNSSQLLRIWQKWDSTKHTHQTSPNPGPSGIRVFHPQGKLEITHGCQRCGG